MNSLEMELSDDDESDDDIPDFTDLPDDEVYGAMCSFQDELLDKLYQIQEENPDALINGMSIDAWIEQLQESLDRFKEIDEEYAKTKHEFIEAYAKMVLNAEMMIPHFGFTFASWVARRQPPSEFVESYFDPDDAQKYIRRNPLVPDYHHN